jgi:uncharacterized protein
VVALIVKMDDAGLKLASRGEGSSARFGKGLVAAMPRVLSIISVVGTAAMLWVGGHIILIGLDDLGLHAPYDLVHGWEEAIREAVSGVGGVLAWLTNTAASAVLGAIVGAPIVAVQQQVAKRRQGDAAAAAH